MLIINVNLNNQTITCTPETQLAEKSLGKVFCKITKNEEWAGLSLRLIFKLIGTTGAQITRQVIVNDETAVPVPAECLQAGELFISAVGNQGDSVRMTAGKMDAGIRIDPVMALRAAYADQLTPSEFEQLLSMIGNLNDLQTPDKHSIVEAINWIKNNSSSGSGSVSSVNGQTGDVHITAADVGAVTMVNGQTNVVDLGADDVGAIAKPSQQDAGKIPVANSSGGVIWTEVENAEETYY